MHNLTNGRTTGLSTSQQSDARAPTNKAITALNEKLAQACDSKTTTDQINALQIVWGETIPNLEGLSIKLAEIKNNFLAANPTTPAGQDPDTYVRLLMTAHFSQNLDKELKPQLDRLIGYHQSTTPPDSLNKAVVTLLGRMSEAVESGGKITKSACLEDTGLLPNPVPLPSHPMPPVRLNEATMLPDVGLLKTAQKPVDAKTATAASKTQGPTEHQKTLEKALEKFPEKVKSSGAWAAIKTRMANYSSVMDKHRNKGQTALLDRCPEAILEGVASIKIYTQHENRTLPFERELGEINLPNGSDVSAKNREALGTSVSGMRNEMSSHSTYDHLIYSFDSSSIAFRAPFEGSSGIVKPVILSVPVPALSSAPEKKWEYFYEIYDTESVKKLVFKNDNFRRFLEDVAKQIKMCAREHPDHRVVLSEIVLPQYVKGLPDGARKKAMQHGIDMLAKLSVDLESRGKTVVFTAKNGSDHVLQEINNARKKLNAQATPLNNVGPVPGGEIQTTDIIVKPLGPHSLVGHKEDGTAGFVEGMEVPAAIHAMACNLFSFDSLTNTKRAAKASQKQIPSPAATTVDASQKQIPPPAAPAAQTETFKGTKFNDFRPDGPVASIVWFFVKLFGSKR